MLDAEKLRPRLVDYLREIGCQPTDKKAICPLHDDHDPSLNLSERNGTPVWYCPVCNKGGDLFRLYELKMGEKRFPDQLKGVAKVLGVAANGAEIRSERIHPYHNAAGELLFEVVIRSTADGKKKSFCRRPDGKGGFVNDLKGIPRPLPLFRLPELLATNGTVWIVEGEKDADRLRAEGLTATCNPLGAGKWSKVDQEPLKDRPILIVEDNDEPGRGHSQKAAMSLDGFAESIRVVDLRTVWADAPEKADISDALAEGISIEAIEAAATPWSETPVENVELVELDDSPEPISTTSTISTPPSHREHPVPPDSVLSDFLEIAREHSEAPESFSTAAMLAVCGRAMTPNIWMDFGGRKFPNLYNFITAPPAVRKSTAVKLPERIAAKILPPHAFHQGNASDSALFSVFEEDPHRLQIESEANVVVSNWSGQHSGRELANRYLRLYDAESWVQTFRHQGEHGGEERRVMECASLSLVLAGTFNCCRFRGVDIASGLRRRFGYYVEETTARLITWPRETDDELVEFVASWFRPLTTLTGQARLTDDAMRVWGRIQRDNRRQGAEIEGADESSEARRHALGESPSRILKLAMIFEACRWAKDNGRDPLQIQPDTLEIAEAHQADCIAAAAELDTIGKRAELTDDAERIVSVIQSDMMGQAISGFISITRSDLTRRFAANPSRGQGLTPHRLHDEIMPRAMKRFGVKRGKRGATTVYQFPVEG